MAEIAYYWKPALAFKNGRSRSVTGIVLHSTDGHKEGDIETLTGPKVSVHWYVTKLGEIYHFVDNSDTAFHVGRPIDMAWGNAGTIGIEQEHVDGAEEWPRYQVRAVGRLVTAIRQAYGFKFLVKPHSAVAKPKGRKDDPVDYPWGLLHAEALEADKVRWAFRRII